MGLFTIRLSDELKTTLQDHARELTHAQFRAAQSAVRDVAIQAHEKAREMAAERLRSTRRKYADALHYSDDGLGVYTVSLDADAAYLEEGFSSFSMLEHGLARGPASKISKSGNRYVRIPFETKESWAKPGHPEHGTPIQGGRFGETKGSLAQDLRSLRDAFGAGPVPGVQGAAWRMTKSNEGPLWTFRDAMGNTGGPKLVEASPTLRGVTRVQYEVSKRGGGTVNRSAYITWRTASEGPNSAGKWVHPGAKGARIFPELETWAVDAVRRRLGELFSG